MSSASLYARTATEKCNISFSTDIVIERLPDKHDMRRHLFDELKKIIPELKGI